MKLAATILITAIGCLSIIQSAHALTQKEIFDGNSQLNQSRPTKHSNGSKSVKINKAAKTYYEVAKSKAKLEQYQEALVAYDKAIEIDPNYSDAYYGRGYIKQYGFKDESGAFADYNTAIQLNPNYAEAYTSRGGLKQKTDINGALADYSTAIRLNPNYAGAYASRGGLKILQLGDNQGGLEDLNKMIELDPSDGHYLLRSIYKQRLGDNYGAIADLRQIARMCERKGDTKGYLEMQKMIRGIEARMKLGI
jgi:tetratricopeptide (TPR) repeat protein